MKNEKNSLREQYERQTRSIGISKFIHYSDYTDYGDLVQSDYSEDAATLEDVDPNEK